MKTPEEKLIGQLKDYFSKCLKRRNPPLKKDAIKFIGLMNLYLADKKSIAFIRDELLFPTVSNLEGGRLEDEEDGLIAIKRAGYGALILIEEYMDGKPLFKNSCPICRRVFADKSGAISHWANLKCNKFQEICPHHAVDAFNNCCDCGFVIGK